jgi:8-oxo-dGTP pyrophosphatase MutT (NUDIX family)
MPNDKPIAHTADGRPLFDNTPTVVAVIAFCAENGELITVRRNNEPGKGLIGLPGGYHMRGETWQQAGVRELFEETGYTPMFDVSDAVPLSVVTDEYGNNLIIVNIGECGQPADDWVKPDEVQEVILRSGSGNPADWAFPRHFEAVREEIGE